MEAKKERRAGKGLSRAIEKPNNLQGLLTFHPGHPLGSAASCCVAQLFTKPLVNPLKRYYLHINRMKDNNRIKGISGTENISLSNRLPPPIINIFWML